MKAETLYVIAYVDRTDAEQPKIVEFGPTSHAPHLLRREALRAAPPSGTTHAVVLPVMAGGLLRVSQAALVAELARHDR